MAAIFKGCKREFGQSADQVDWSHMDEAVMEYSIPPVSRTPQPVITVSPQPFPHS
jgi:hypothetical protein